MTIISFRIENSTEMEGQLDTDFLPPKNTRFAFNSYIYQVIRYDWISVTFDLAGTTRLMPIMIVIRHGKK